MASIEIRITDPSRHRTCNCLARLWRAASHPINATREPRSMAIDAPWRCGSAAIVSGPAAGQYPVTKQRRQCAEGGLRCDEESGFCALAALAAVGVSAAQAAEKLKVAIPQRGFWDSSLDRVRRSRGLLQGGRPRGRGVLHRRRRADDRDGRLRQRRHRHVERHPRRDRRLREGRRCHALPHHLGGDDRRARAVLVGQGRQPDQDAEGRGRGQDHRVLVAGLVVEPDPADAAQAGRLQGEAGADRRRARRPSPRP